MSCEKFGTVQHHRTGRVHLTTTDREGTTVTLCGKWARRDHYKARAHHTTDADCEICWDAVAAKHPPRRRTQQVAA